MSNSLGEALGVLLAIALMVYTFWPDRSLAEQSQKTRLEYLQERKEQLYENLRDLNFEHKAGKYPEQDYLAQRALLESETAELMAEMDQLQKA